MNKFNQRSSSRDSAVLRVGVIGTGAIGTDHIRRIMDVIHGAVVTAVTDFKPENAERIASRYGLKVFESGEALIASDLVDAVVIASSDDSHAQYVVNCIQAGKQVLCEKPLATTVEDCLNIVRLEEQAGQRLVQVGFMRRYDQGYQKLKQLIVSKELGELLMIRSSHRNKTYAANHTSDMTIKNSGIHELDIIRWLTGEEYADGLALTARQNSTSDPALQDPQLLLTRCRNGITSEVEVNMNSGYGYDIQCEIICEKGTARLSDPQQVVVKQNGIHGHSVYADWSQRFVAAYDAEFQDWVDSVKDNHSSGASAWDGYAAQLAAQTLIQARASGQFEPMVLVEQPALYRNVVGGN